jgi:TPR repeat protein
MPGCSGDPRPAGQAGVVDPDTIAETGRAYMTGASGYPRDSARAREMFEAAAQKGSGAGLLYLGLLAYEESDLKAACGLFAQSALRGHPGGLREYGECQLQGAGGVAKDPRAAARSFKASIANGGVQAYESLARLYGSGEGVPKDPDEKARLLQKHAALRAGR